MEKGLNQSIIDIRVELQNSKIKKSGKNKFAGFDYYELADFLPKLNELMQKENVNDMFYITNDMAVLELVKGSERNTYTIPFVLFTTPLNKSGQPSMQDIQYLGALNTYYKRYLYLNAFGITDGEIIDSMDNDQYSKDLMIAKATKKQIEILKERYVGDNLTKLLEKNNISSIEELPLKKASELIERLEK